MAIVLAVGMTAVLQVIGAPLTTDAAPQGILSYEFAGSVPNAQAIVNSWQGQTLASAGLSLGLDFLYPLLYAAAISLSCLAAAPHLPGIGSKIGQWLAQAIWLAAALDYIENISLIQLLFGSTQSIWPPLAWGCAAIKFTIVLLGFLTALIGGILALVKKD
ncbi:MAG: hypothetical protein H6662_00130 [Ardenticatenaceae bacterium]|nr:hypothetical protein [Anaerolineales bacterium]MCB8919962.1 hypothetical protein [Ardenticatenaceae bacterium]MCB8989809.1 hypothetical protein [Ardenticatenaceae bacterium]MCB9003985.1 hypothetical protein [Ardenticatenaceae bacterium]